MISIVVPVYNSEKYLKACIDRILEQEYREFELILVDDGSTDESGTICDEYAQKDDRVKVIHQQNAGLSAARNKGLEYATGEYILWVDSDDIIAKEALAIWLGLIEKHDADMAIGKIAIVQENEDCIEQQKTKGSVLTGEGALKHVFYGNLIGTTVCGILIKAEIARRYPFPVGKYHEDDRTSFRYYLASDKVAFTDEYLYYYIQHTGSIMHRPYGQIAVDELDAGDYIVAECVSCEASIKRAAEYKRFCNYCQVFLEHPEMKKIDEDNYVRVCTYFDTHAWSIWQDREASKRMRAYALAWRIGRGWALRMIARV